MRIRTGLGFDVHRTDPERELVLGGVALADGPGLVGHSDADAAAHACADALLGAAGLGDLGEHFSDSDPRWAGADSIVILGSVAAKVRDAGWEIANVDCTIITESPKLAPHRDAMVANLSSATGAPVSVKATRPERLGALGRGEGMAALAVALIVDPETAAR